MKAFGTCLKVLKATNEKSESLRMSLNLLKRIFNILKWLSNSEEISFRAKRREGVEGTLGALPLDSMINHAGLINHKMLPVCFISFSVTDRTFTYFQRVTFLCYAVQFRPLNKKMSGVLKYYPYRTPSYRGKNFNIRAIGRHGNKMQIFEVFGNASLRLYGFSQKLKRNYL